METYQIDTTYDCPLMSIVMMDQTFCDPVVNFMYLSLFHGQEFNAGLIPGWIA